MDAFTNTFLGLIEPGTKLLDLGAGSGKYSNMAVKQGAIVTAVDHKAPKELGPGVTWHTAEIQDWIDGISDTSQFDVVLMRNVLQFLERSYVERALIPKLKEITAPGGHLAIETFWREPDPAFKRPFTSLWSLNDLKALVDGWEIILENEFSEDRTALVGSKHEFGITDLVLRKP